MLEDADGVKTGTTGPAGPCLVSSATRGNQETDCCRSKRLSPLV